MGRKNFNSYIKKQKTRNNSTIKDALSLVTAAVVGVVLNLTLYLGKAVVFPRQLVISQIDFIALSWILISFIAMYRYKINMISWIVVSAIFGLVYYLIFHQ